MFHIEYIQERLPLVSVIIPTYNNGQFVDFALQSLFRQTYPKEKTEIIVIDDGSIDNTLEILEKYKDRISYIRQQNKGIASARNRGISIAKGEIITFIDADDMWYDQRLEKIVERFREKQDCGMVYHLFELIDSKNVTVYDNFYKAYGYREGLSGWITNEMLYGQIFCGGSSFAFRKEVLKKTYPVPEDIKRGIDYYMTVISSCFTPVEYIPDILGKYRFHSNNITMFAGQRNYRELGEVNKDFAHTRQKIIEKLSDAIKQLPLLYRGKLHIQDLLRAVVICVLSLFIPAAFYTKLIKVHEFLKRLKIIRF